MIGYGASARVLASALTLVGGSATKAQAETVTTGPRSSAAPTPMTSPPAQSPRECITIDPPTGPLSARFREELRLAADEGVAPNAKRATAPTDHAPSEASPREADAGPCDRRITITDDEVTVEDVHDGADVPLDHASRPLADATLLRLVEVARTRRGTSTSDGTTREARHDGAPLERVASESHRRDTVVALNPLALGFARLSVDAERPLGGHHALHASVHAQLMPSNALYDTSFFGGGGEIGYRYYTGTHGAEGLFVGPSLVGGLYARSGPLAPSTETFAAGGPALDVGYASFLGKHAWLAVGIGVQYTWSTADLDPERPSPAPSEGSVAADFSIPIQHGITTDATGPGIRPRLLVSLGWAF